ncbi:MAG: hypothetical protein ACD_78C00419G0001 [uncultured bacterium (gcode 4)]|uniref:Fibrobacter succinogenes major paralogous domain-containing protein n=1 Tax=uncultured bacterium (gcode 4) TaxID=1234023 RepID=K1XGK9_9BACT|nr:MAG: hypothetical protein ACD_78C00419G0001 [uncultured bacterium (gcode 4)]
MKITPNNQNIPSHFEDTLKGYQKERRTRPTLSPVPVLWSLVSRLGFTLVELIVVITILIILGTISLISFQDFFKSTRDATRISVIKSFHQWLQIYNIKSSKYPDPDNYTNIEQVSKQGYIGENIIRIVKISGNITDPLDGTYYTYSTNKDNTKIQLSAFLEEDNVNIFFSHFQVTIFSQIYADSIDYKNRYPYTYGDRIGIFLDETTNQPIQEIYGTGVLNIVESTGSYTVQFTNTFTNSGTISGSGTNLLTTISIIQNSCVLWNTVINNGWQIQAYNSQTVPFGSICTSASRQCNNGIFSGDMSYGHDSCSISSGALCTANAHNGYIIPDISHEGSTQVSKAISLGTSSMSISCFNGNSTYGQESIDCWEYVYDEEAKTCNENLCKWYHPTYFQLNGLQKYNIDWIHNASGWDCHFICQSGYYWDNIDCIPADIGYIVATVGQTTKTACSDNTAYQDQPNQSICKTVSVWYYSTPIWTNPKTDQSQCEENYYCQNGIKISCPIGYSSLIGSTNIAYCTVNIYAIIGNIANGNGATINGCGKTTTADTNGSFSLQADYATVCNNITATRANYTCFIATNGPASLTSDVNNMAGNCVQNPICWTDNGTVTTTAPIISLCTVGAPSIVTTDITTFTWNCSNALATPTACNAPRQYIATFDGNGSTGWFTESKSITANTSASLTTNGFSKTGYTFVGWSTIAEWAVVYANEASYAIWTANGIFYAKWTINTYTVSWTITSLPNSTISICWQTGIPTNASGQFSITKNYGTVCNNLWSMTRINYVCTTTTNGPASLTSSFTTVAGNCASVLYPGCDTLNITLSNGQVWAACNIGSSVAGITATSYGSYYQWGNNSTTWTAWWTANNWGFLWQWPCATGYHVPTQLQWQAAYNNQGASLPGMLKLPMSGNRSISDGSLANQEMYGFYWSSSPYGANGYYLYFYPTAIIPTANNNRALGFPVRCLRN